MTDRNSLALEMMYIGRAINAAGGDVPVYTDCDENSRPSVLKQYAEALNALGGKVEVFDCDANTVPAYVEMLLLSLISLYGGTHAREAEGTVG